VNLLLFQLTSKLNLWQSNDSDSKDGVDVHEDHLRIITVLTNSKGQVILSIPSGRKSGMSM
jgi:hypothetical protein